MKMHKGAMTAVLPRTMTAATTDAMTVGIAEAMIGTTIIARIREIGVTTAEITVQGAEAIARARSASPGQTSSAAEKGRKASAHSCLEVQQEVSSGMSWVAV